MNKPIICIDLIRFFAALIVSIFHLLYWIGINYENPLYDVSGGLFHFDGLASYTWFGWVGVEIFFVISGFIIAYASAGASPIRFLKNRALRLFPAAFICSTLTLIAVLGAQSTMPANEPMHIVPAKALIMWIKSITFFPRGPWIDTPYWTLPIEVSFYILVFLCLLINRLKWLPTLMIAIGGLSTLWNAAVYFGLLENSDIANRWAEILLLRHGCEFGIGVLLWRTSFQKQAAVDGLALFVLLLGGCIEIASRAAWGRSVSSMPIEQPLIVPITIWLASIAAVAGSGVVQRRIPIGLKAANLIRKIGITTYPFYLLHSFVGGLLMKGLFHLGLSPLTCGMVALATMATMAAIISSFLEPLAHSAILKLMTPTQRNST